MYSRVTETMTLFIRYLKKIFCKKYTLEENNIILIEKKTHSQKNNYHDFVNKSDTSNMLSSNKYITGGNVIKEVSNAIIEINKTDICHYPDIFSINEDNFSKILEQIKNEPLHYKYNVKCITYALKTRPKQKEMFLSLIENLGPIAKSISEKSLSRKDSDILVEKCVLIDDEVKEEYKEEDSVAKAIMADDINKLIEFSSFHDFNPNKRIAIDSNDDIYFVDGGKHVTYAQIMALYGSIKCFKHALINGSYNLDNLAKYAIAGGNIEIIHLLEQINMTYNDCFEVSVKYHNNKVSDWLLRNYKCENFKISNNLTYFNNNAFFFFLKNKLYTRDCDIDMSFIEAVKNSDLEMIKYLTSEYKVYIEMKDTDGRHALHIACENEDFEIIKYLVEQCHANVNIAVYSSEEDQVRNETALHIACMKGNMQIISYLVEKCHVNIKAKMEINIDPYHTLKYNALHIACDRGDLTLAKYLIKECHLDVEKVVSNLDKKSPLQMACETRNIKLIKFLVEECNANVRTINIPALHIACDYNDIELVKYLVEECHVDVEGKSFKGRTGLLVACEKNNTDVIHYLVEKCHANIETKDFKGITPLQVASAYNFFDLVQYLVEKNHANISDTCLNTSHSDIHSYYKQKCMLHKACQDCDLESVVRITKEKYCYIDGKYNKKTALHYACEKGNLDIIKYLIEECNASIAIISEEKDNQGTLFRISPLHFACMKGHMEIVKYLIEKCHSDVELRDQEKDWRGNNIKKTALHIAIDKRDYKLIKYLIEVGKADVNALIKEREWRGNIKRRTALHVAVEKEDFEMVKYLVEVCHADVEEKDERIDWRGNVERKTALHIATEKENLKIVKYLIEVCHAKVEEKDERIDWRGNIERRTAFNIAVDKRSHKLIKYFIEECKVCIKEKECIKKERESEISVNNATD